MRIQNAGTEVVEAKAGAGERQQRCCLFYMVGCCDMCATAGLRWTGAGPGAPPAPPPHASCPLSLCPLSLVAGSATLSMAYAAARMAESVLLGLEGEQGIVECTFVESEVHPDFQYFASKVGVRTNQWF